MKSHSIKQRITIRILVGMFLLYSTAIIISTLTINNWLSNKFDTNLLSKANVIRSMLEQNADLINSFQYIDEDESRLSNQGENTEPEYQDDASIILDDFAWLWDDSALYFEKPTSESSGVNNKEYYQLWFKDGSVLGRSNSLEQANLASIEKHSTSPQFFDIELPSGESGKAVQFSFAPVIETLNAVELNMLEQEEITIVLAQSTNYIEILKSRVSYVLFASIIILLATSWWIIRYSLFKGMTPLEELQTQLTKIHADNFDKRVKLSAPAIELDLVEKQLNELLKRLEASYKREKLFSSNVAHELRTPICEVRNIAEVELALPSTSTEDKSAYQDVYHASLHMQEIVDNLLTLARLERPLASTEKGLVNIYNIIEHIKSKYETRLTAQQIQLDNSLMASTLCFTNQGGMELVIVNLIDNAINYSPENTSITVGANQQGNYLTLSFTNIAQDLEQRDLSVMCDRLWRKDKSRTGASNSGIGLSLVKAYSESLGFTLALSLSEKSQFTVKLNGLAVK